MPSLESKTWMLGTRPGMTRVLASAALERFSGRRIVPSVQQKMTGRPPMTPSWEPAIPQAMQRHNGSARTLPAASDNEPCAPRNPAGEAQRPDAPAAGAAPGPAARELQAV
jgi:hypothetical protein